MVQYYWPLYTSKSTDCKIFYTKRQVELVRKKFFYTMYGLLHKWQWLRSALCLSSDFIKKLNHNLLSWRLITVQLHVAINMAGVLIQWTGWAFHPRKSLCNLNFVHAKFPLLEGTAKSWGSNCWCLVVKCQKKIQEKDRPYYHNILFLHIIFDKL